jgi:hypothetical protein
VTTEAVLIRQLTCSGRRKTYDLPCGAAADWGVRAMDGETWHGACYFHVHQVLKRLGADGARLEVRLAAEVVASIRRAMDRGQASAEALRVRPHLLHLVEKLRDDENRVFTQGSVMEMLERHGTPASSPLVASEALELLCEDEVLEARSDGVYGWPFELPYE